MNLDPFSSGGGLLTPSLLLFYKPSKQVGEPDFSGSNPATDESREVFFSRTKEVSVQEESSIL